MDRERKWMSLAAISAIAVFLAVTAVTARSWNATNTPLYIFRMEQASSDMSFSPTPMNAFAYLTEKGYNVHYDTGVCNGVEPLEPPTYATCDEEICTPTYSTCCVTCDITCVVTCSSCVNTCYGTCPNSCSGTCIYTCDYTCVSTCRTCVATCWWSCSNTCID